MSWWQWVLAVLALLPALGIAVLSFSRATGWMPGPLVVLVSAMPYVAVASVLVLAVALASRVWPVVALAGVLAAVNVAWQLPMFVPDGGDVGSSRLVVATANLKVGGGDAQAVVAMVRDHRVDVLALEELTPGAVARLQAAGLDSLLPYSFVRPAPDNAGTGIWSRTPLHDERELDGYSAATLLARTTTVIGAVQVGAVHPRAPVVAQAVPWYRDYDLLRADLDALTGPVVVAGDFNATRDHAPFRALEGEGYRDAVDQAGAGFLPTFPNGREGRPLVGIDHVIVRDLPTRATAVERVNIPFSDHLALVVTYGP